MIGNEECFTIWAPDGIPWTEWAKPVLFASVEQFPIDRPAGSVVLDTLGIPEGLGNSAVVVDLPGAASVAVGLSFAERGFRPVPVFNGTIGPSAVVDVRDLVGALGAGALVLKGMAIRPDAPPAFLLDANRKGSISGSVDGRYDNRWVVLPQDFPSATFLQSQRIREVTLIASGTLMPAEDLAHVLLRWQEGGLRLAAVDLAARTLDENLKVPEPSLFRRAWYGALALSALRRSNVGGFGAFVPEQTTGGGFYG